MTNFLVTVAILAAGLVNSVILARWLGPTGRGEVAAAILWPSLLPYLGGTGMIDALVYYAARPAADIKRILGNGMLFATVMGLLLCGLGILLLPWLLANQSDEVVRASQLMLIGVPVTLYGEMTSSLLRARLNLGAYNLQRLIVPVGYLLLTVILYVADALTLWNIVISQISLYLVRFLVSLLLCRLSEIGLGLKVDWKLFRSMLAFGSKSHIGAMAEQANSRLDQALIAAWLSPAQLGLYVAAVSATSLMNTIPQALKITILPRLAGEVSDRRQNELLVRSFRLFFTLSIVAAPLFCVALYWVIPLVYGPDFKDAILPAMILVLGSVVFGAKDILSVSAKAVGLPWLGSRAELAAVALTLVLLVILLPTVGIVGAAIASVTAYSVAFILVVHGLRSVRSVSILQLITPDKRLLKKLVPLMLGKKYT